MKRIDQLHMAKDFTSFKIAIVDNVPFKCVGVYQ